MGRDGQILHLFGWDKKFTPPFIAFMQENFPIDDHHFIIYGAVPEGFLSRSDHVTHYRSLLKNLLPLLRHLRNARKIILHGLFSSHLYYALALHSWLLKKCYWVIWGGDLYIHNSTNKDWRYYKNEWFRKFVISRLGHFVTYIKGDYELARQWYGARGEYHECLMYSSNVFDLKSLKAADVKREAHSGLNILVGNSADPSNNHLEVLEKLLPYKEQDIRIYVPLSYGDQDHAQKVIEQGKQLFGDKFYPITEFMAFDQYLNLLNRIDIAIFNHKRQQAMGNTITLLGMGKKVYIRSDGVTQETFLRDIGVTLLCSESISMDLLDAEASTRNTEIICKYFSKETLVRQLETIFDRG